jgi:hypothetical protein
LTCDDIKLLQNAYFFAQEAVNELEVSKHVLQEQFYELAGRGSRYFASRAKWYILGDMPYSIGRINPEYLLMNESLQYDFAREEMMHNVG